MRSLLLTVLAVGALLAATSVSLGDEAPAKSGPQPKDDLPGSFHPYNLTGPRKGKFHCLVCEHGLNPGVLIFTPVPATEVGEPFRKLLEGLDAVSEKQRNARLASFVIFVSGEDLDDDKRDKLAPTLEDIATATKVKDKNVLLGLLDKAGTPKNYNLAPGVTTVLLYNKYEVVANHTFKEALTDKDVETILKDVEKMIAPKK